MPYPDDEYKLKDKSDTELHEWVAAHKLRTAEYIAGIQESINRNEAFFRKRELIAAGIAILSLEVAILVITVY